MSDTLYSMRKEGPNTQGLIDLINYVYLDLKRKLKVVEIGSFRGESTQIILNTQEIDTIYCIDPWMNNYNYFSTIKKFDMIAVEKDFDNRFKNDSRVIKHKGTIDTFTEKYKINDIDMVYIDGVHTFNYVTHDIKVSLSKIKPIYIAGHDYSKKVENGDVIRAVNTFFHKKPEKIFSDHSWIYKNK